MREPRVAPAILKPQPLLTVPRYMTVTCFLDPATRGRPVPQWSQVGGLRQRVWVPAPLPRKKYLYTPMSPTVQSDLF